MNVPVTVSLDLNDATGVARIRITGPSGVWFGVAFGRLVMDELPYAIIVSGDGDLDVEERKLGSYDFGTVLTDSTLKKVSQTSTADGRVAVELTRPMAAEGNGFFAFDTKATSINVMVALGHGKTFGYHSGGRAAGALVLTDPAL